MMENLGRIVTFYSYKGGTGRSMALANFAWILAANGNRVIVIDWDLEAPGLHRYFRPFLIDPDLYETDGLIDMFWELTSSAISMSALGHANNEGQDDGDPIVEALQDATRSLDWNFGQGGSIDFIGAGRQSGTYSERVNSFDWKRFYDLGGAAVLDSAKSYLRTNYQWILIDSRTGVSDTSGVCTIQMPEAVVACFTLNRQSIDGVTAILRSIRMFQAMGIDGSKIRLFPVATRIENNEKTRLENARTYARTRLQEFLPLGSPEGAREYWDKMEIGYIPAYAFEEVLAIFADPSGAGGSKDTMLTQFEGMAQKIVGTEKLKAPEVIEADRTWVLEKYALAKSEKVVEKDVRPRDTTFDTEFLRNIHAKEALWRKFEYPWRLLLSRRELDLLTPDERTSFGRNMSYYLGQSERMRELLHRTRFRWFISQTISLLIGVYCFAVAFNARLLSDFAPLAGFCGYLIPLVIMSTIQALASSNKPYGLGVIQSLKINLLGPLVRDIEDYSGSLPTPRPPEPIPR